MPQRGGRKALLVGYDDRVEIDTDEYPWRTVGWVAVGVMWVGAWLGWGGGWLGSGGFAGRSIGCEAA